MRLRPLFTALAFVVAGILCEPLVSAPTRMLAALTLTALVLGVLSLRRPTIAGPALLLPFFLLGVCRTRAVRTPPPLLDAVDRYEVLTGRVRENPEPTPGGRQRFVLATGRADIVVTADPDPAVRAGDTVTVHGRLTLPARATNPGEFDYRAQLRRQGVFLVLGTHRLTVIPTAARPSFPVWLRETVHRACFAHLPAAQASLLAGILVSDRSLLPPALSDAFSRTGTIHILSTSGLHLSLLALLVSRGLGLLLPRQRWLSAALSLALIAGYALAAGGSGAVARAAVMAGVFLLAPLVRREPEPLHALALAALLVLLDNPLALFEPGTQLSFATVTVLLAWYRPVARIVWPWEPGRSPLGRLARWTVLGLLAGGLAQLGSAPLVAYHFHLISWIAPLANVFIVAVSELLLVVGLLAVSAGGIPVLGGALWGCLAGGLTVLKGLALSFAALPFAASSCAAPPDWVLILWYAALVLPARLVTVRLQQARFGLP